MPKLKTHRGAKKRIKLSAKGKLLRRSGFGGHFLEKKSSARKRTYHKDHAVAVSDRKRIRKVMGL
ncbi:50S ribosomal protein L35 [Candidatus Microgenomates bacterium]|nr:50S ribosomal protein L35 [Candidatus Microgenomates bacterium]